MNRRTVLVSAMLLVASIPCLPQPASTVPVPAQLGAAHTAFLGSGSAPGGGPKASLITQMVYSSVYRSLSSGPYHLVGAPAEAELSLVISTDGGIVDVINGSSINSAFLRLDIYDTKTHSLLWALGEPVAGAFREKTFQKNVDESAVALRNELKILAAGNIPGNTSADTQADPASAPEPKSTKTRFSDQGKK